MLLSPYEDRPGKVAEEIVDLFEQYQPEAVLDIHNTSGHSPDFAVVTYESEPHEALVSLFCDRLVITDLRLGALMERSSRRCPVVTIECGERQMRLLTRSHGRGCSVIFTSRRFCNWSMGSRWISIVILFDWS